MRPLHKPILRQSSLAYPVRDVLAGALGAYCSMCEVPLLDSAWAWHKQRETVVNGKLLPHEWPSMILLCSSCRNNATNADRGFTDRILWPDERLTFHLHDQSPFVYTLQNVDRLIIDEQGQPADKREVVKCVIVYAATTESRATIDYFALNTSYYDRKDNIFRIPRADYLSLKDRRVNLRTETWETAVMIAEQLRDTTNQIQRRVITAQARDLIHYCGFWSVWATVLWTTLKDSSLLEKLLLPPEDKSSNENLLDSTTKKESTGAYFYPGTRRDWLPITN